MQDVGVLAALAALGDAACVRGRYPTPTPNPYPDQTVDLTTPPDHLELGFDPHTLCCLSNPRTQFPESLEYSLE